MSRSMKIFCKSHFKGHEMIFTNYSYFLLTRRLDVLDVELIKSLKKKKIEFFAFEYIIF